MLEITQPAPGEMAIAGRFDATQVAYAQGILWKLDGPVRLDMSGLDYISSAGIGVIVEAAQRLGKKGHELRFVNLTPSVRNVLTLTGLHRVLRME